MVFPSVFLSSKKRFPIYLAESLGHSNSGFLKQKYEG